MHFKLIEICIWIHLLKMYLDQIQDFSSNWLHSIQCKKTFKGQIPRTKNFLLSPVKFFQAPFYTSTLSHTNLAILSSKYLLNKEKIGPFFVYGSLKWRYVVKINMTTITFFLTLRKLFGGKRELFWAFSLDGWQAHLLTESFRHTIWLVSQRESLLILLKFQLIFSFFSRFSQFWVIFLSFKLIFPVMSWSSQFWADFSQL